MWNFIEGAWKFIKDKWEYTEVAGKFFESTGKIAEGVCQVGTCMNIDDQLGTLKRKYRALCSRADDLKGDLANAESSRAKKPRTTVENWLADVENSVNKVDKLLDEAESQTGVAILSRLQYAKQAKDLTGEVEELLKEGEFPQGLTLNTPHDGGVDFPTKKLVGLTFQENFEKIWRYLIEPEVLTIGIWGMGGVGKTTLVTHINNQARKHHNIFNGVFWVTVSQNLDIRKMQDEFAKSINLSFNNEQDERKRAAVLSSELKKRKCLFILDDVWHHFDLDRVGIPVEANGSKLIITTRSQNVCDGISCQEKIKVQPLSKEEAWDLFKKNIGDVVTLSPEVYGVARLVAGECAGLPLGIITVARCMRGVNDAREWRCALKELQDSKRVEMEEEVFQVLKFSYNRLRDTKLQQSFLYCALYPEDCEIGREELVQRLIDEGIIEAKESRQDQLDSGRTILNELVRSSLLEETVEEVENEEGEYELEECVKMHDLLRDMAINMKSTEFMVKSGMQLEELPGEQEWSEDLKRVSLMRNYIQEIVAVSPRCPKLSTLLLSWNYSLNRIENSFFQHMPTLQILDLTDCTSIEELPDSVSNLKNLTALVLHRCHKLRKLPSLAVLELMKRLDLYKTRITEVPRGLERLVRLTYLDLRAYNLQVLPTGILPKLLLLEFLTFNRSVRIKVEELQRLERLGTFEGRVIFDDVNGFKSYVMSGRTHRGPNFNSYSFELNDTGKSITKEYAGYSIYEVKVKGLNMSKRAAQEEAIVDVETIEAVLKDVQSLKLEECYGARNLCDVSWLDSATHGFSQFVLHSIL